MNYKFNGWDWTDILEAINELPIEEFQESVVDYDNRCANRIRELCDNAMKSCWHDDTTDLTSLKFIEAAKAHCLALAAKEGSAASLWRGLCEVKKDYDFLAYFKLLFQRMWW